MRESPSVKKVWLTFFLAVLVAATVLLFASLIRNWGDRKVIGFLAAWAPFLFSLIFALTPGRYMRRRIGVVLRLLIAGGGLLYSVILWHDRTLEDQATEFAERSAVTGAVSEANEHSDAKIEESMRDLEDKLQSLDSSLGKNFQELKPVPPEHAQLQFSLFDEASQKMPIVEQSIMPDENGVFSVDFVVTNVSDVPANSIDLWVQICDACVFAKEPQGFDKPAGEPDTVRHRTLPSLNPGVSMEAMTLSFKTLKKFRSVTMTYRYSCATCGAFPKQQDVTINMPPLHLPKVQLIPPVRAM